MITEEKILQRITVERQCVKCAGTGKSYENRYHNQLELEECIMCKGRGTTRETKEIDITDIYKAALTKAAAHKNRLRFRGSAKRHDNPDAHNYAVKQAIKSIHEYNLAAEAFEAGLKNNVQSIK